MVAALVRSAVVVLIGSVLVSCSRAAESSPSAATAGPGQTRTYFIAADDVAWDYTPGEVNRITGGKFEGEAAFFVTPSEISLGHIYKKTIFREYTDATFTTLKPRPAAWQHLGLLGPLYARRSATPSRSRSGTTRSIRIRCILTA